VPGAVAIAGATLRALGDHPKGLLSRANPRGRKVRLFDDGALRVERTEQAVDGLRERFGHDAVRRATLLKERPTPPGDPG
jgi:hypothetical protein